MNSKKLRIAGYFAMASAVLGIPLALLSYHFSENKDSMPVVFWAIMQLGALCLFTYLYSVLKKYLNQRFSFHEVDNYIDFLIMINIFVTFAGISGNLLTALREPLEMFSLLLIISFGTAQLFFGIKLFQLSDTLQGMLKPFCFLSILTGIFIATIVLLPIASLTGAITDVMLGTIFFQASESPEELDAG
ncbi:MAG TPA: hypothetical protein PLI53_06730 [Geobacteraceae bacterium]|nr:hypothetical protein [Geobacteraceae bacterium]